MADSTPVPAEHEPPAAHGEGIASFLRRTSRGKQMVDDAFAAGIRQAKHRRARVLAHPDLAALLCEPPYSLPTPEMWNGYVAPAQIPMFRHPEWKPNDSPIRKQVMEILFLVAAREEQAEEESA